VDGTKEVMMSVGLGLIILISFFSAIFYPFETYATTLATFGIAHVAIELRYINHHFHQRFGAAIESQIISLLLAIVMLRVCSLFGVIPNDLAPIIELICGLTLVLLATGYLWQKQWKLGLVGLVVAGVLGLGIIQDPIATSVILAIVHNLTPIGFMLEQQRSNRVKLIGSCIYPC
jgi:hypothetical protein